MTRSEAIEHLKNIAIYSFQDGYTDEARQALKMAIEELEESERKTGKWIKLDMHAHLADHKCTACGQECYVPTCMGEPMYTYCPNCGCRMEGDDE